MTKVIRVSRMISKGATKKAIKNLLVKPKEIKKDKPMDWTVPKEERKNHIKRSWTTGT